MEVSIGSDRKRTYSPLTADLCHFEILPFGSTLPLRAARHCHERHRQQLESFSQSRIASLSDGKRNLNNRGAVPYTKSTSS